VNIVPKEVMDQLEAAQSAMQSMNTKLDTVIEYLGAIHEELRQQRLDERAQ
jgi:hypothetical protein